MIEPPRKKGKGKAARYYAREPESEEDTDFGDSDDERGKTALKLFASLAGIDDEDKENKWWFPPPSSPAAAQNIDISRSRQTSEQTKPSAGLSKLLFQRTTHPISSPRNLNLFPSQFDGLCW